MNENTIEFKNEKERDLVNNPNTSYISPLFLYKFIRLNFEEDDNPETYDTNKMMRKYRNILEHKGVDAGIANKLYIIATRVLKKYHNNDKMNDLREFNANYKRELLNYSRGSKTLDYSGTDIELAKNSKINLTSRYDETNSNKRTRRTPSPYDVPKSPFEPPSPFNKKK